MQNNNLPLGFKYNRVLLIYNKLMNGEVINKKREAELFNVTLRSIQRDIEDLRCFLVDNDIKKELVYDKKLNGYRLVNIDICKPNNKSILEGIDMSENETKKKPTTKKTTSTRKKKVEEKPKTETMNLNEVKEELNINDNIKSKVEYAASSHIEMMTPVTIDTVDQKINTVKDSVNNNMKSIISIINANGNNSIITTKAEMAKTNSLIKEKSENINDSFNRIERLLNATNKINLDSIKMSLDQIHDNVDALYKSISAFVEQDENISEIIEDKYKALYENLSLIADAIVNDDEKSVEDLLTAQNKYIKDLMEKNNERINLNSERMNMVIGNMSALSESIKNNQSELMSYIPEYLDVARTEASNIMGQIDESRRHYDIQLGNIRDDIKKSIEKHDNTINALVKTNIITTIIIVFIIILGFVI